MQINLVSKKDKVKASVSITYNPYRKIKENIDLLIDANQIELDFGGNGNAE